MTRSSQSPVRTDAAPDCLLCGGPGAPLQSGLSDRHWEAPGSWSIRGCGDCGVAWLDPRPVPEDLPLLYGSYYTHGGGGDEPQADGAGAEGTGPESGPGSRPDGDAGSLRAMAERRALSGLGYPPLRALGTAARLLALFPPVREMARMQVVGLEARPGGRALDVGCGDGALAARLEDLGWEVDGVEPDATAAARARHSLGGRVWTGTLEESDVPEAAYDVVTLVHVLEHLPDPAGTLRIARGLLRPGGRVVIVTPNLDSLGRRLTGRSWLHWDPPRHLQLFSRRSLEEVVSRAGLTTELSRTSPRMARWTWGASRRIAREGRFPDAVPSALGRGEKIVGTGFQLVEHLFPARAGLGEELVLSAAAAR